MMKKIVFLFISLLLLTGCSKGKLTEINYKEYEKKILNEESFVLVIGKTDCNYCMDYKETLNELLKDYDIELYYIDTYKFEDDEKSTFLARIMFDNNNIVTPTTIYIEKGREKSKRNRLVGSVSKTDVIEYLKEVGLINESK